MSTGSNFDAGGSPDLRHGQLPLRAPGAESGGIPVAAFPQPRFRLAGGADTAALLNRRLELSEAMSKGTTQRQTKESIGLRFSGRAFRPASRISISASEPVWFVSGHDFSRADRPFIFASEPAFSQRHRATDFSL